MSELKELFEKAVIEINSIKITSNDIVDKFKDGVSLRDAYKVIDLFWTGNEAVMTKTSLSSKDEVQNGNLIIYSKFNSTISPAINLVNAKEYLSKVFPIISEKLQLAQDKINSKGLDNEEALEKYISFHKAPALFCSMLRNNWITNSYKLVCGDVNNWEELTDKGYEVPAIDDGSFINWTDYPQEIIEVEKLVIANAIGFNADGLTIKFIGEACDQVLAVVLAVNLFIEFVDKHLE